MSLLTLERSSPSPHESENEDLLSTSSYEGFVARDHYALCLSPRPFTSLGPATGRSGDNLRIFSHLKKLVKLLRSQDQLRMAVELENSNSSRKVTKYLVIVTTTGHMDTEETVVLGTEQEGSTVRIGLVLPLWRDTEIKLDGDGGFSVHTGDRHQVFKPSSVQSMWAALQMMYKATRDAQSNNYYVGGLSHTWMTFYSAMLTTDGAILNEWNLMEDVESFRTEYAMYSLSDGSISQATERGSLERVLTIKLREVMLNQDLEETTCKQLRLLLQGEMKMDLTEYRGFLDQQMLRILGQMERPSQIFDYLYLGSEWNASNLHELKELGVKYILNISREIDNFYPEEFKYLNIRLYDLPNSELMKHWDKTYTFLKEAKTSGKAILVHCKMGISRSAATVMAYAMKEYKMSLSEALSHVKSKRSVVNPNDGFLSQLQAYEGILRARHNELWGKMAPSRPHPLCLYRARSQSEPNIPAATEEDEREPELSFLDEGGPGGNVDTSLLNASSNHLDNDNRRIPLHLGQGSLSHFPPRTIDKNQNIRNFLASLPNIMVEDDPGLGENVCTSESGSGFSSPISSPTDEDHLASRYNKLAKEIRREHKLSSEPPQGRPKEEEREEEGRGEEQKRESESEQMESEQRESEQREEEQREEEQKEEEQREEEQREEEQRGAEQREEEQREEEQREEEQRGSEQRESEERESEQRVLEEMEQEGRDFEEQGGQERKRGAEGEEETDGGPGDNTTHIKRSREDTQTPSRPISSIPEDSHDGGVSTTLAERCQPVAAIPVFPGLPKPLRTTSLPRNIMAQYDASFHAQDRSKPSTSELGDESMVAEHGSTNVESVYEPSLSPSEQSSHELSLSQQKMRNDDGELDMSGPVELPQIHSVPERIKEIEEMNSLKSSKSPTVPLVDGPSLEKKEAAVVSGGEEFGTSEVPDNIDIKDTASMTRTPSSHSVSSSMSGGDEELNQLNLISDNNSSKSAHLTTRHSSISPYLAPARGGAADTHARTASCSLLSSQHSSPDPSPFIVAGDGVCLVQPGAGAVKARVMNIEERNRDRDERSASSDELQHLSARRQSLQFHPSGTSEAVQPEPSISNPEMRDALKHITSTQRRPSSEIIRSLNSAHTRRETTPPAFLSAWSKLVDEIPATPVQDLKKKFEDSDAISLTSSMGSSASVNHPLKQVRHKARSSNLRRSQSLRDVESPGKSRYKFKGSKGSGKKLFTTDRVGSQD